jgi:hypothetical protein
LHVEEQQTFEIVSYLQLKYTTISFRCQSFYRITFKKNSILFQVSQSSASKKFLTISLLIDIIISINNHQQIYHEEGYHGGAEECKINFGADLTALARLSPLFARVDLNTEKYISAATIAANLRLHEVQVRKDLAAVSPNSGKPRAGFEITQLIQGIEDHLGITVWMKRFGGGRKTGASSAFL